MFWNDNDVKHYFVTTMQGLTSVYPARIRSSQLDI